MLRRRMTLICKVITLLISFSLTLDIYGLETNSICRKSRISRKRYEACRREPELIKEVAVGNEMAIRECQENFAFRKWNCTTTHRTFNKILKTDTREAAYLNAITAAGILHSVTSACSSGKLWQCHCDRTQRDASNDGQWEWGGCSDDTEYGYNKSRLFTDSPDLTLDIKALLLMHNNEAGRLAILKNVRRICKCHGLSGSCALQTCWRKMPQFQQIGSNLKSYYDGAPKVSGSNDGYSLIPVGDSIKPPSEDDLVYTNDSPDFCNANKKFGTAGTMGRQCNADSQGPDGCGILCCGRGYNTKSYTAKLKCRCRFVWCCDVICDVCYEQVKIHTCK